MNDKEKIFALEQRLDLMEYRFDAKCKQIDLLFMLLEKLSNRVDVALNEEDGDDEDYCQSPVFNCDCC